mgnify:CR=1 FL=1
MANSKKAAHKSDPTITDNRKAFHDYFIEERFEAGLELEGWEVKSLRAGKVQLRDCYVLLKDGEAFLLGCLITPLISASTHITPDAQRTRRLLLHREEINHLWSTAIPLTEFVLQDIRRLAQGARIDLGEWRKNPTADAAATTNDLYRKAQGLRDYQQQFVEMAFRHHVEGDGARFLLADQVGLGKTPQMALAAALMGQIGRAHV